MAFKFADSFLYAKPVESAYLEEAGETVYWLNGTAAEHNHFNKLIANEDSRQEGFFKAVYGLACDENGKHILKGKTDQSRFLKECHQVKTREFGMLILGYKTGAKSFDQKIEDEEKNLKTEKENTKS